MRTLLTLITLLAALSGCASPPGATVEFDDTLEQAITTLVTTGGTTPLKDLAPGPWTSVRILIGPATATRVEKALGTPTELDGDGTYDGDYVQEGNLLAFEHNSTITRLVSLGQLAALPEGTYPADVVLRADGGLVTMTDPSGLPLGG